MNQPSSPDNPYYFLAKKYNLTLYFEVLQKPEPVPLKEFRKQKYLPEEEEVLAFPNKFAIDFYFQLLGQVGGKLEKPYCLFWNESTGYYVQKYIPLKKRRMIWGEGDEETLIARAKKKFTDKRLVFIGMKNEDLKMYHVLKNAGFKIRKIYVYTIAKRKPDVNIYEMDVVSFFTPKDVEILLEFYPDLPERFRENKIIVAAYGENTVQALQEKNIEILVRAPTPESPSLLQALDKFLYKSSLAGT